MGERRDPQPTERFTKSSDLLIGLGLPPRLVLLYGKLAWHAGADGLCYPKMPATLAEESGLKDLAQHLQRLLKQLQRLKLIEWKRTVSTLTPIGRLIQTLRFCCIRGCNTQRYISDVEHASCIEKNL